MDGVATAAMAAAAVTAFPPTAVIVPSAVNAAAAAPGGTAVVTEAVADPLTYKRVFCCFIVFDLRFKCYKNRSREIL